MMLVNTLTIPGRTWNFSGETEKTSKCFGMVSSTLAQMLPALVTGISRDTLFPTGEDRHIAILFKIKVET